jgi:hypothetical protein
VRLYISASLVINPDNTAHEANAAALESLRIMEATNSTVNETAMISQRSIFRGLGGADCLEILAATIERSVSPHSQ